jgi:membrane-associated protein
MDLLRWFLDFVLHLDKHLAELTTQYGTMTYAILFAIVFCETGLVVTPFLPGDSLLFAAGAITAIEDAHLSPVLLGLALMVAAIIGDTVNYQIGKAIGPRVMKSETSRLFNKKHLERTHAFFEKHGGKAIIIARFAPILRTFAPFVAGAGAMSYPRFIAYNVIGGVAWVGSFLSAGYFFGNIPQVKRNFTMIIMAIIVISLMPAVIEFIRARRASASPSEPTATKS